MEIWKERQESMDPHIKTNLEKAIKTQFLDYLTK